MKIRVINKNIYHFIAKTQHELTSTFVRLEEFYESPFPEIQGKYFTLRKFKELYAASREDGKFTYFQDWGGFNIPGDSILEFNKLFQDKTKKEEAILSIISKYIKYNNNKFYIIGTIGEVEALDHEYAHAQYYLNPEYKQRCEDIYKSVVPMGIRKHIATQLLKMGYDISKVADETQAYLATSKMGYMLETLNFSIDKFPLNIIESIVKYQDNFDTLPIQSSVYLPP